MVRFPFSNFFGNYCYSFVKGGKDFLFQVILCGPHSRMRLAFECRVTLFWAIVIVSILVLDLFGNVLLFQRQARRSILCRMYPSTRKLKKALGSTLLGINLTGGRVPYHLLIIFQRVRYMSQDRYHLLGFVRFSTSSNRNGNKIVRRVLGKAIPSRVRVPFRGSVNDLPSFHERPLRLSHVRFTNEFGLHSFFGFLNVQRRFVRVNGQLFVGVRVAIARSNRRPMGIVILPTSKGLHVLVRVPINNRFCGVPNYHFRQVMTCQFWAISRFFKRFIGASVKYQVGVRKVVRFRQFTQLMDNVCREGRILIRRHAIMSNRVTNVMIQIRMVIHSMPSTLPRSIPTSLIAKGSGMSRIVLRRFWKRYMPQLTPMRYPFFLLLWSGLRMYKFLRRVLLRCTTIQFVLMFVNVSHVARKGTFNEKGTIFLGVQRRFLTSVFLRENVNVCQ